MDCGGSGARNSGSNASSVEEADAQDPSCSCAIYVRRSARNDIGMNRSVAEQELEARAFAEELGKRVVRVYVEREGVGASVRSRAPRPAWDAALADLSEGLAFHTLVVHSQSRLTRQGAGVISALLDSRDLVDRRIVSLDGMDTADSGRRLQMTLRAEIDREESERIATRVARTKRFRRDEGRWLGGKPPFGTRVGADGRLERDPDTFPVARSIADALLAGQSLYQVCRTLNEAGVPAPSAAGLYLRAARERDPDVADVLRSRAQSAKWGVSTLSTIVRAPGFAGLQGIRQRAVNEDGTPGAYSYIADVYRGTDGAHLSIGVGVISPDERAAIVEALDLRSRRKATRSVPAVAHPRPDARFRTSLLIDVLQCPECGGRATVSSTGRSNSYKCANYAMGAGRCGGFSVVREPLERYVLQAVRAHVGDMRPDHPSLAAIAVELTRSAGAATRTVDGRIAAARSELERANALVLLGIKSAEQAREESAAIEARLRAAESELADLHAELPAVPDLSVAYETIQAWEAGSDVRRRWVLDAVVARVVVSRGSRGKRFAPQERVTITWR